MKQTVEERFERHFIPEPNSGCFIWTGYCHPRNGYGHFGSGPSVLAHRMSWEMNRGGIPKGLYVLHRCDTPCCVNPDHLFLGTQKENIDDCRIKGRLNKPAGSRHVNAKLTESQALKIKYSSEPNTVLGLRYGVSPGLVGNIKHSRGWKHLP
jgi:Autographiviridae endonuclease